jgi:hypothetical protein
MYQRIIAAGKSIQVLGVKQDEVRPLLDAIGNKGVYIMAEMRNQPEADEFVELVEPYR